MAACVVNLYSILPDCAALTSVAGVREFGGHVYTLLRVERAAVVPYRNFRLHNGIALVMRDDEGRVLRYTAIRSIAERAGRFKIYSMTD